MIQNTNTTYQLIPNPLWTAVDNVGYPCVGARLYTYRHGTREPKMTYRDPLGHSVHLNPIMLDANGQATIYWASDEPYYIELYDRYDQLVFSRDHYAVVGGACEQQITYHTQTNYCRNAQFSLWSAGTEFQITDTTDVPVADAWRLQKSHSHAHDVVHRQPFALGQTEVPSNPMYYLECCCEDIGGGGEKFKRLVQPFPRVHSFANQTITLSLYAKASAPLMLECALIQHFGSGGAPSPDVISKVAAFELSSLWQRCSATYQVPAIYGKTVGQHHDDALLLAFYLPIDTVYHSIALSNVQLQLGKSVSDFHYKTFVQQQHDIPVLQQFPTGWLQPIYTDKAHIPNGWIVADDGTIGNEGSQASNRAHADTRALFCYLWNQMSDDIAPVSDARGQTALDDFYANKTIQLPILMGRSLMAAGHGAQLTERISGSYGGAETHTLTKAEIPPHTHTYLTTQSSGNATGFIDENKPDLVGNTQTATTGDGSHHGVSGLSHNNMSPWAAVPMMIKL